MYTLTSADNPTLPDEAYTYDGVGNRLTSSEASDWTYNANNELVGYNGITFAYDENGNTIQKTEGTETTYYIYNEEDRLTRVEDTAHNLIATYYYDPFGRRLWKEVAGNRTCFLYSDEGLIGEYDADGTELKTYGYKPNSTWTTDPLFLKTQSTYYFYQTDYLGTPCVIIAVSGAVAYRAKYEAFGRAEHEFVTIADVLRLPGQIHDPETELQYNYYRYYDPKMGRYFRPDPTGLDGGINGFIYVDNRPVNRIDPKGLTGLGAGGYFVAGAEFSYNNVTCCEKKARYNVKVLTVCGGAGIGVAGKSPLGISQSFGGITSRSGCPRTRYYAKHETTFVYHSVNVQGDSQGPSAGIESGIFGIGTAWVFCSDTVLSKKLTGECCDATGVIGRGAFFD